MKYVHLFHLKIKQHRRPFWQKKRYPFTRVVNFDCGLDFERFQKKGNIYSPNIQKAGAPVPTRAICDC